MDEDNNIYIGYVYRPFINKYDQAGNLLKSYPIDMERRGLLNIYCDNSGRIFMAFYYDFMEIDKVSKTIIDTSWDGICQVGNAERAFSFEEQKSTIKKWGFLGSNSAALSKGYFRAGGGNIYLISFGGDTIKTYKSIEGSLSFLGCDENLNIYTTRYDLENRLTIVRKYNQKSELVSKFGYRCDKPYKRTLGGRNEFLDSKGNIYVFCESYKDGIKVSKWYKSD